MPRKPGRPCRWPGCPGLAVKEGYCGKHQTKVDRQYDRNRGTAAERGYDNKWRQYRKRYLSEHPLCVKCLSLMPSRLTEATVVDHVRPHNGQNDPLFWNPSNHQALCKRCHDRKTAMENGAFGNRVEGRGV